MRTDLDVLTIDAGATIRQGMKRIDENRAGIVLVVDAQGALLGTVTDGDVRRAILKSASLEAPLTTIMATSPTVLTVEDVRGGDGPVRLDEAARRRGQELMSARRLRHLPVLGVTSDVVLGLGIGADDYVTKPFSPRELTARVKAMLRRARTTVQGEEKDRVEFKGVIVDATRHEVTIDGQRLTFTATEFRLLHFLANHPGRVFTRDQIIGRVIGEGAIVIDRNIDVHVRSVRKKLGQYRDCIETIRGVGYRFADED